MRNQLLPLSSQGAKNTSRAIRKHFSRLGNIAQALGHNTAQQLLNTPR